MKEKISVCNRKIIKCLCILGLGISLVTILFVNIQSKRISMNENVEKVEISLEQAVQIGEKEANKYYDNLKLTEVHSYDNDYEPSIKAGKNGSREWWYVNFANEKMNYVNILIADGKIVEVEAYDENWNNGLFELEEIKITSKEAVKKASELGLRGGNPECADEWVSGYNYKISYASLVEKPEEQKLFFEVIGISRNGNFAHVDIDATTGEILLAEEKLEDYNGEVTWKQFE